MTYAQQAIEKARVRDSKGRYVATVEGGWRTKSGEYQREYLKTHPWVRNWQFSKSRARTRGMEHTLTAEDFHQLWERDGAGKMQRPSIDRIDPKKGYIQGNCRFLELTENISLGNKGVKRFRVCPHCGYEPNQ